MQIFILVDKKDICSKHTWATLVQELDKQGTIEVAYFNDENKFILNWEEYLNYDEYTDAVHNYKIELP